MFKTIITTIALSIAATSASADFGAVYKDGKYVGTINEVMMAEGKTAAEADKAITVMYTKLAVQRKKDRDQESRQARKALEVVEVVVEEVKLREATEADWNRFLELAIDYDLDTYYEEFSKITFKNTDNIVTEDPFQLELFDIFHECESFCL